MYEGSLIGAGSHVFAVIGYVIGKKQPCKAHGSVVRINPRLLAAILGEKESDIQKAIDFLCAPDPHSGSKEEEGKRLVKVGEFDYWVVNGAKYDAIRNEEDRKEQNRQAQERYREKLKAKKEAEAKRKAGTAKLAKALEDKGMADANARDLAALNDAKAWAGLPHPVGIVTLSEAQSEHTSSPSTEEGGAFPLSGVVS